MPPKNPTKTELEQQIRELEARNEKLSGQVSRLRQIVSEGTLTQDRLTRMLYRFVNLLNLPGLHTDENWNIVGEIGSFPAPTSERNSKGLRKLNLREILADGDFQKVEDYVEKTESLADKILPNPYQWELLYSGPTLDEKIDVNWLSFPHRQEHFWSIRDYKGQPAIYHQYEELQMKNCFLMYETSLGTAEDDLRFEFKFRTPDEPDKLHDISAVIHGSSARSDIVCDENGYTILTASNFNSQSRIQRNSADVVTRDESLECGIEYRQVIERIGGRVTRYLTNLATGETFPPLEYIDSNALYDLQHHIGIHTFSGEILLYEIKVFTRPSVYSIVQFIIPNSLELKLREKSLAERTYLVRIAENFGTNVKRYSLLFEDITSRRKLERDLRESQSMLQNVLDNVPLRIFWKDRKGRFLGCNNLLARDAGLSSPRDIVGKTDFDMAWSEDESAFFNEIDRQIIEEGKGRFGIIEPLTLSGGETIWLETNKVPLFNDSGEITGILGAYQDITERLKEEQQLREREESFRLYYEMGLIGMAKVTPDDHRLEVNDYLKDLLCLPDNKISGMTVEDLIYPDDLEVYKEYYDQVMSGKSDGYTMDARFVSADGDIVYTGISVKALRDGIGNIDSLFLLIQDQTGKIISEWKEERRRQQLIQADKMISLGVLVAGVAHEVNNPNNFIMMNTPLLRNCWVDIAPIVEEYFEKNGDFNLCGIPYSEMREHISELFNGIIEGSRRIETIVRNLKNYARKDESYELVPTNINDVLHEALSLLSNQIKNSTNNLSVTYSESQPLVRGNFQRIEQVLINIVQNACQALRDREGSIDINVFNNQNNNTIVVKVTDDGVGIPAENISHLTDPFFTTKRNSGGTGLGLSISQGIIRDHGGDIKFRSEPGKKTVVSVILPAI